MGNLLNVIKDTPIPTILVVAGVFFLVLAISEQIAGKIAIDPSRRRQAIVFGLLLLGSGIGLQIMPKPNPAPGPPAPPFVPPNAPPNSNPKPAEPQPTPDSSAPKRPPKSNESPFLAAGDKLELPTFTVQILRIQRTGDQSMTRTRVAFRILTHADSSVGFYTSDEVRLFVGGVPHAPQGSSSAYIYKESSADFVSTFDVQGQDENPVLRFSDMDAKMTVGRRLAPVEQR